MYFYEHEGVVEIEKKGHTDRKKIKKIDGK